MNLNTHGPLVSVIIPTYNRVQYLERALHSVLDQTFSDYELIIIDDGSTDDTNLLLKKYKKRIRIFSILHSGVSAARNFGIEKSHGEWITFLDSDDFWLPEKLEKQMEYMRSNPKMLISQVGEKWIRNGKFANPMNKHMKHSGWIFKESLPLCIVSPSAVIIHSKIFKDIGNFDVGLTVCEDYDLWLRISRKYQIGLIPETLIVKIGGHKDQLSRQFWGMDRFRIMSLKKLLKEELTHEQRELVLKEIIKKLTILSIGRAKRPELPNVFKPKIKKYQRILNEFTASCAMETTEL